MPNYILITCFCHDYDLTRYLLLFKDGDTPLHDACKKGSTEAIAFLLSTGIVNPNETNNDNKTPIEMIKPRDENRFEILKLFLPFQQCHESYPIDSYAKVFFCGNTTAGKSSLDAVLIQRAKKGSDHKFNLSECVTDVVPLTAGIATHILQSHEIGNVVLYDLAGHREYYSSHTAVLEHLMLRSPAVFCVLSKLTDDDNNIANDLYFWLNFIENINARLTQPSQVIVIASHVDLKDNSSQFKVILNDVVRETVHHNKFSGFVGVDCHRPGGKGVEELVSLLAKSCKAVVDKSDSISIYSHVLYAFLLTLNMVAITLQQLCALLEEKKDPSLPSNESALLEFLTILSDKGLILFLRRDESQSWIIIKKEALLEVVNGTLFAPFAIKRVYRQIASNTGVVSVSALATLFPDYDCDMLVSFMIILEFCHVIDSNTLHIISTNLAPSFPVESGELLYIPALVTAERPTDITIDKGFGWCLWCSNPHQFFPTRFLFRLLLLIAYKYCLPDQKIGHVIARTSLACCCKLWKNGIYWISEGEVEVMIQTSEFNRCVTLLISDSNKVLACKLRSQLIADVFYLKKDICPSYSLEECLILSSQVNEAITASLNKLVVSTIGVVSRAMLLGRDHVINSNGLKKLKVANLSTRVEPYSRICPAVINELFDESKADKAISSQCFSHIVANASYVMDLYVSSGDDTYMSIRCHLNRYSVFAGRNPLVS